MTDQQLLDFYLQDPEFKRYAEAECGPGYLLSIDWENNVINFHGTKQSMSVVLSKLLDEIKSYHKKRDLM